MAAGTLAAPGTQAGPCAEDCQHTDCAATRAMADAECAYCDEPIGYETRFYRVREIEESSPKYATRPIYAHARCEEGR